MENWNNYKYIRRFIRMLSRPSMSFEVGFRSVTDLIRLRGDDADKNQSVRDDI